jgi:carbamoyl-phosphate synthase large subunit
MRNILITSAGRRVSLIRYFKDALLELGLDSKIYITDLNPELAPAYYFSDGFLDIPPTKNTNFISSLLEECLKKQIKLIIPTSDLELFILGQASSQFQSYGITIAVSKIELIETCRDKRKTDELFSSLSLDIIPKQNSKNLKFPVFVKPFNGSLSKGIAMYNSIDEIPKTQFLREDLIWMDYLSNEDFNEFTVDCYYNKDEVLKCVVPRQRIEVRGGEISKGKTVKGSLYDSLVEKLNQLKGARGCVTLQVFYSEHQKKLYGIEINPRFGGGFPLSYHAGANFPLWLIKEYFFDENIPFNDHWVENKYMIRYDQEIIF